MTKQTERVLTGWLEDYKGTIIQPTLYVHYGKEGEVSWRTMCRYIEIEPQIKRCYYSVREIVDILNECAGEDCYGANWEFKIDDEGRIYEDETLGYLVKGWK